MNANLISESIKHFSVVTYSRSGGPGGQNVNKLNTKVTLKLCLDDVGGLFHDELERVKLILANRISTNGELIIASDEERSQRINLERAYARMEKLITSAAKLPKQRRPTKPSKAAKEKRLQAKKHQGQKKAERAKKCFT